MMEYELRRTGRAKWYTIARKGTGTIVGQTFMIASNGLWRTSNAAGDIGDFKSKEEALAKFSEA